MQYARDNQCLHARVVHQADAGTNYSATNPRLPATACSRYCKSNRRRDDSAEKRDRSRDRIICSWEARVIGKHRYKVGRPDARRATHAREEEQGQSPEAATGRDMRIDLERRQGRGSTDESGKHDQPIVVLRRKARDYAIHGCPQTKAYASYQDLQLGMPWGLAGGPRSEELPT